MAKMRKALALLLTLSMLMGTLGTAAFAAEDDQNADTTVIGAEVVESSEDKENDEESTPAAPAENGDEEEPQDPELPAGDENEDDGDEEPAGDEPVDQEPENDEGEELEDEGDENEENSEVLAAAPASLNEEKAPTEALQEAINAGGTVTLEENVELTATLVVGSGTMVTLDLNGCTLSTGAEKTHLIINNGDLTITGNGTISRTGGGYVIDNQGTLTIESGMIVNNAGNSSTIRNGGNAAATLNIKGGTIQHDTFIAVKNDDFGVLNMTGGKVVSNSEPKNNKVYPAIENWSAATLSGGSVEGVVAVWTGAWSNDDQYGTPKAVLEDAVEIKGGVESALYEAGVTVTPVTEVTGGTFSVEEPYSQFGISLGGKIIVSGGSFDTDVSDYLAPTVTQNADHTVVPLTAGNGVAEVGGKYYSSLQAAIDAAVNNDTVRLLKDASVDTKMTIDKQMTLDLGTSHLTLNGVISVAQNGDLTMNADKGGKVTCNVVNAFTVFGTLLINEGEYESTKQDIVGSVGTTTIKGGTFKCTNYEQAGHILTVQGGTMTVEAGTFEALVGGYKLGEGIYDGQYGFDVRNGATLILGNAETGDGPTVTSVYAPIAMNNQRAPGNMICYGGTYTCTLGLVNEAKGWEKFNTAIYLSADSNMDIYGGTFVVAPGENATAGCKTHAISIPYAKPKVVLNIHGGSFESNSDVIYIPGFNSTDGSGEGPTVMIDGGAFSNDVNDSYVVDGADAFLGEDGKWTIGPKADSVAAIGNVGYTTLQGAIDAAKAGETVTLVANPVSEDYLEITEDKDITLDLNGKTLNIDGKTIGKNSRAISVQGKLTVKDSTDTKANGGGTGHLSYESDFGFDLNGGTLIVDSGSISGTKPINICVGTNNLDDMSSTCTINGGKLNATSNVILWTQEDSTLTLNGGELVGASGVEIRSGSLIVPENSTVKATGKGFAAYGGFAYARGSGANIFGAGIAIDTYSATTVNIAGGEFSGYYALLDHYTGEAKTWKDTITVTGGTFTADNEIAMGKYGEKLSEPEAVHVDETGVTIAISDGTFTTEVPVDYCAENYVPVQNGDTYGVKNALTLSQTTLAMTVGYRVTSPVTLTAETTATGEEITWSTSNEAVATVVNGVVTAVGVGTADITATVNGVFATCVVTVTNTSRPSSGSSSSSRPTTPVEEDLQDEETPLSGKPFLFEDVAESDWFYGAVRYVFDNDLMEGTSETRFSPYMLTNRGMIVTMLHRLEGEPEAAGSQFPDVAEGQWYTNAVAWAVPAGVAKGYDDGSFGPEDEVTREQLALFLFRYAQMKGYDVTGRADLGVFTDGGDTSDWALDAMAWAVKEGVLKGRGDNVLDPMGSATRSEAAEMLMNFSKRFQAEPETEPEK